MPSDAALDTAARLLTAAAAQGRSSLSEPEAKEFLAALGIPVPAGMLAKDGGAAAAALRSIGAPVVIKAVAAALTHKTEAGGVAFPIDSAEAAEAACARITASVARHRPGLTLDGFLVEAYRPAQPEWILGLRVDPLFGPAIMFGLGGIYVEALRQITFRLAPLREADIDALLTEKPAMRLLVGGRGQSPAAREALKHAIRRLSDLALRPESIRHIGEIEINPLTVTGEGVLALDALIVLRPQELP